VSDARLVRVGRWVTFAAMAAAIVWSPFIAHFESIFQGVVSVICYIAPPITAVFVWGVFWKRASGTAATWTLYLGSALGFAVFLLDWFKERTGWNVPSMMATFYLFVVCSVLLAVISWIRPHAHTEESRRLVWEHPLESLRTPGWPGLGNYKLLAGVLFVVMIALYVVFR
jgi:SSS family solute:Na+ symporter